MKEIYGCASRDELYHYGVKGMKWRNRKLRSRAEYLAKGKGGVKRTGTIDKPYYMLTSHGIMVHPAHSPINYDPLHPGEYGWMRGKDNRKVKSERKIRMKKGKVYEFNERTLHAKEIPRGKKAVDKLFNRRRVM